MAFNKITDQDVAGLGVSDLPDVPGLTAADLKAQFDEYSRYLKNRFNQLIDELAEKSAAEFIGSEGGNVQADIDTLKAQVAAKVEESAFEALNAEVQKKANAADVIAKNNTEPYTPAEQYNPATKGYVDEKLVAIGAGDMQKSIYDADGSGVVDDAEKLGGMPPEHFASAEALAETAAAAMPRTGGTFNGVVRASDTPRVDIGLRNIGIWNAGWNGMPNTNRLEMVRK